MAHLPTGTITFLFTDIEGSTRRWEADGPAMSAALARHDAVLRTAIAEHGGHVFKTVGDAFCAAFAEPACAIAAAYAAQIALVATDPSLAGAGRSVLRVRIALHVGVAEVRDGDYFGPTLNRIARLLSVGHGGQVLLSRTAYDLARDDLPVGAGLLDLGEHRLKDLARPEHVFQLVAAGLPDDYPPLRSLDTHRHNLPVQLTSFVGRAHDIAAVTERLADARLLTLTGVGGTGKTRLALQVAAEVLDAYPDGVWLIELAPLADPDLVPETAAAALGVREVPGRPMAATLSDHLRDQRALIVLDNCEHVLDAAARLADALLRAAPRLTILATSREALGVPGEAAWPVPPLPTPAGTERLASALGQYEAVRLFIDRAVAVRPDFSVTNDNAPAVAEICHRLDGIPLALELAAARIGALTPDQIATRLDARFRLLTGGSRTVLPRQQTLRGAIDWSYDLLPAVERRVLERLAVFAGTCRIEAAEAVCASGGAAAGGGSDDAGGMDVAGGTDVAGAVDEVDEVDVVDALTNLVAKSLVVADTDGEAGRYRLLETIRQYALEKLVASGDEGAARDRHLDWHRDLVAQMEYQIKGPNQIAWLHRLERQHDNLRAALTWGLADQARTARVLALAAPLWRFWTFRGHLSEGHDWLDRVRNAAMAAGLDATEPDAVAWVCLGESVIHCQFGQLDALARIRNAEARSLFASSGNEYGLGYALHDEAVQVLFRGDSVQAEALLDEVLTLFRRAGQPWDEHHVLTLQGDIARLKGDYNRAAALNEACIAIAEQSEIGIRQLTAMWPLHNLGWVELHRGRVDEASTRFSDCVRLSHEIGAPGQLGGAIAGLAAVSGQQSRCVRAARLFGAAQSILDAAGYSMDTVDQSDWDEGLAHAREQLDGTAWDRAWSEGRAMSAAAAAVAYALADEADDADAADDADDAIETDSVDDA